MAVLSAHWCTSRSSYAGAARPTSLAFWRNVGRHSAFAGATSKSQARYAVRIMGQKLSVNLPFQCAIIPGMASPAVALSADPSPVLNTDPCVAAVLLDVVER